VLGLVGVRGRDSDAAVLVLAVTVLPQSVAPLARSEAWHLTIEAPGNDRSCVDLDLGPPGAAVGSGPRVGQHEERDRRVLQCGRGDHQEVEDLVVAEDGGDRVGAFAGRGSRTPTNFRSSDLGG
jgi:hypothetical protein